MQDDEGHGKADYDSARDNGARHVPTPFCSSLPPLRVSSS